MSVIYVVPIIESVSVEALSLTILSVNVAILTDGGQRVDNYTVRATYICICVYIFFHHYKYIYMHVGAIYIYSSIFIHTVYNTFHYCYQIVLTTSNNYFNGNTTITIILDSAKGPFSIPILEGRQHVVMVIATSQIGESMAFTVPYISELPCMLILINVHASK